MGRRHLAVCDVCETTAKLRDERDGFRLPWNGWRKLFVGSGYPDEAEVCSDACALEWLRAHCESLEEDIRVAKERERETAEEALKRAGKVLAQDD